MFYKKIENKYIYRGIIFIFSHPPWFSPTSMDTEPLENWCFITHEEKKEAAAAAAKEQRREEDKKETEKMKSMLHERTAYIQKETLTIVIVPTLRD